jgi:phosphoribosyl-AMP cyclohydrolase
VSVVGAQALPDGWEAAIRWNADGLVPVIAQEATTKAVLMLAWANAAAVARTLETGRATYWSRSRQELWEKGLTSGNTQKLVGMRLDCDGDALLYVVDQTGPACHTGARTCFDTRDDWPGWGVD